MQLIVNVARSDIGLDATLKPLPQPLDPKYGAPSLQKYVNQGRVFTKKKVGMVLACV